MPADCPHPLDCHARLCVPRDTRSFQHTEGLLRTCCCQQGGLIGQACYPRSTFYLLSDGPSIRDHRITKADFRPCSSHRTRSQAPLYLYALDPIANRAEGTLELLRYCLGGDRPSQTAHLARSTARIHGPVLELTHNKGGVSSSAPPLPE